MLYFPSQIVSLEKKILLENFNISTNGIISVAAAKVLSRVPTVGSDPI